MLLAGRQVIGWLRSTQSLTNCQSSLPLKFRRVAILADLPPIARCYATDRPVSRPKAHTGRPTSTRKLKGAATPKKASKTAAKTSTTTATKPKAQAKTRTKTKSKTKKKPKTKTKAKPKAKPKKKVRKVLTEEQKADVAAKKKRSDLKALKELALKPPATKPSSAWAAIIAEKSGGNITTALALEYRSLSTEDREHYNHVANQNKAANAIQYRRWIESHPVDVIRKANLARNQLRRKAPKHSSRWRKLIDDREVKGRTNAFMQFCNERRASGDFKGIHVHDALKRIGQEWKQSSAEQRQPYVDSAKQDSVRYAQEVKTVYNKDVGVQKQAA